MCRKRAKISEKEKNGETRSHWRRKKRREKNERRRKEEKGK